MDYTAARHNMVESQVRTNRVDDPAVVDALETLPREAFVPKALAGVSYVDEALEIAPGRYIMEPLVVARLAQAAKLSKDDVVLLVGCGAGYMAAVLAHLSSTVVAVESDEALIEAANTRFAQLGIDTVAVVLGDLKAGYPDQAPYDAIVFNGAVSEVPTSVLNQLNDGGRCVSVIEAGDPGIGAGEIVVHTRVGDSFSAVPDFDAGTPLLPGFAAETRFTF